MTEQPLAVLRGGRLVGALVAVGVLTALLDLFALLQLPDRAAGHLVPVGPLLAFVGNAALGYAGLRILTSRLAPQVVLGVAILLSTTGAGRGPGGDLFVTRDLQTMYLLFVLAAAFGASVPLFLRRPSPRP